ncbi:LOW QUALITY PROTEIN: ras association domain-containing protein 10-like [Palaemon carinicauda]|uniref:LOW QUALITY PROTEIN: ras association domain-containing protein 10-like n=1 Tax=Palaemon carinicauda TaxID=392227 RepID=UPI0035B66974
MTSEVEIGVWVEGVQKWVTGVTRRTTCHDVIKALLRAQQNARIDDSDVNHYVIVERWRKVERPLDHEQRILKVWRTWGEAVGEVRFSLRRVRDGDSCLSSGGGNSSIGRPERSRRRHKWRHAHHSPKETVHPKKLAREDPKFCETMERLMRLVVAQGETIQTQLRRLQEREHQIEQYEQQMHLLRVQNLGTDYLLHSYLKDDQGEMKDEPGSEEKSNDSGVVTEESALNQEEENAIASGTDELEEIVRLLGKIEQMNTRLLHEEEALAGMLNAVEAADEQQKDEAEILQQELACVALAHAQLVTNARQNEITLREMETVLWQQRKELEALLREDSESDMETRALQQHLNYIIHLPPTAFRLPDEEGEVSKNTVPPPAMNSSAPPPPPPPAVTVERVPSVPIAKPTNGNTNLVSILKNSSTKNVIWEEDEEDDDPPPLPACPPPVIDDEDDGDSANNSSLCVSSRSSTSSEASTSSSTSGLNNKVPDNTTTNKSTSTLNSPKNSERSGKDTDSTDSNSDTGLSSLHSSSDEGVYVLDTLV